MKTVTDITVAGLATSDAGLLTVTEIAKDRAVLNFPGGHIERGEAPEQTVVREVREETGFVFAPDFLLGCYAWIDPVRHKRHLRLVYVGSVDHDIPATRVDDPNILRAEWLSAPQLRSRAQEHRYPIVGRALADFEAGVRLEGKSKLAKNEPLTIAEVESIVEHL